MFQIFFVQGLIPDRLICTDPLNHLAFILCSRNNLITTKETGQKQTVNEQRKMIFYKNKNQNKTSTTDLFLHSYDADFIADLIRKKEYRLARSFNLSFRYIDDVLSLTSPNFGDLTHRIYPKKGYYRHCEISLIS